MQEQVIKIEVGKVIRYTILLYKKYFVYILITGLFYSIFSLMLGGQQQIIVGQMSLLTFFLKNTILIPCVNTVFFTVFLWFVDQNERGNTITLITSVTQVYARYIFVLAAQFIVYVIIIVGTIIFIVPGLVWALLFSQVIPLVLLRGQGIRASFATSKNITKGNRWSIAKSYLAILIPVGLVFLILSFLIKLLFVSFDPFFMFIWMIPTSQLGVLITYSLWRNLTQDSDMQQAQPSFVN